MEPMGRSKAHLARERRHGEAAAAQAPQAAAGALRLRHLLRRGCDGSGLMKAEWLNDW